MKTITNDFNHSTIKEAMLKNSIQNIVESDDPTLEFSKVGIFNPRDAVYNEKESESIANVKPLRDSQYWMIDSCQSLGQRVVFKVDRKLSDVKQFNNKKYKQFTQTFTNSPIRFTSHCLQRIKERTFVGITFNDLTNEKVNSWIMNTDANRFTSFDDETVTMQTDVIIPFRDGALLGILSNSELEYKAEYKKHKLKYQSISTTTFYARTFIAADQLTDDQQYVVDHILL